MLIIDLKNSLSLAIFGLGRKRKICYSSVRSGTGLLGEYGGDSE